MKIERDKFYLTRVKQKVRVIAVDAPGEQPVVVMARIPGAERPTISFRYADGRRTLSGEAACDLVREYREPKVIYVNEYQDGIRFAYHSAGSAKNARNPSRAGRIAVKYVEVLEGGD